MGVYGGHMGPWNDLIEVEALHQQYLQDFSTTIYTSKLLGSTPRSFWIHCPKVYKLSHCHQNSLLIKNECIKYNHESRTVP